MQLAKVRPLLLLCLLMRLGVEGFAYSAARAFAPQRWAGATEALPRVLLPRGGGRAGSVVSAASDDTTPLEEKLSRTKAMLDAEDYAGAADESAAALEVLPDLAEAARLRGRALLDPLLDQMLAGAQLEPSEFGEAYEAFRLAAVMDPENNEEARMELVRIEELCKMAADARKGATEMRGEVVGEGGDSAASQGALRFEIGTRVECQTGELWAPGVIVGRYYREPDWPEGQVAPYQIQMDDGKLIYAPADSDECIRAESNQEAVGVERTGSDVIVVGAGAAGIGVAFSLTHTFGLDPSRVVLLERGDAVGASFRSWPAEMRFISPSFNQQGWTGSFDLNSVAHGTSPAFSLHAQHPSGAQYAEYLNALSTDAKLDVRLRTEVLQVERLDDGSFDVHVSTAGKGGARTAKLHTRYVVWAAGEFAYPREDSSAVPGGELCIHNSRVRSWAEHAGDEHVIIGGYESGVDAAINLAKAGKQATVLASTATWNVQTPDPSTELAPYTAERLREVTAEGFSPRPKLMAPLRVKRVERTAEGGFNVVAEWGAPPPPPPAWSQRQPFTGASAPAGAEGSELVVHTAQPPVLCAGFEGSVASVARDLFDLAEETGEAKGCLAGAPLLTEHDESTKVPGVFLVGPTVVHGDLSFCFIYKFRQRFGIVADAICRRLGRDTRSAVQSLKGTDMYMDDLSCCESTCGEVC